MERIKISSSVIASVVYDGNALFMEFVSGEWYKYLGVPETIFARFRQADSHGQFFNQFIKPVYSVVRLTNPELETVRRMPLQQSRLCPIAR